MSLIRQLPLRVDGNGDGIVREVGPPFEQETQGDDRQAGAALHHIVCVRLRFDPRIRGYCERRSQEGKVRREVIRRLDASSDIQAICRSKRRRSAWSGTVSGVPCYRGIHHT